jgi:hypothetical protein
MLLALVGSLILAAAAAYWLTTRRSRPRNRPAPERKTGGRFGAVEIRLRNTACEAARALEGQRFLSKDAPALPLPACSAAKCSCSFAKLSDRRSDGRRSEHGGPTAALFLTRNRRNTRDRRRAEESSER